MTNKQAVSRATLNKIDATWPFRQYNKHVGNRPALEIPLLAGVGALGGAAGAKQLGYNPWVGAGLTGLLAALYGVGKHVDTGGTMSDALQSLLQTDYYKKHPEASRRLQLAGRLKVQNAKPVTGKLSLGRRIAEAAVPQLSAPALVKRVGEAGSEERSMWKEQCDKYAFFMGAADELDQEVIPVNYSRLLVASDPFLAPSAKILTGDLLLAAKGGPVGMTSGRSLYKAAIKAGAGYGAAYLFGRGLTSVLGAGTETSKKLSTAGGIAAAVINSGILNELGE